jgi:hypothetical protein
MQLVIAWPCVAWLWSGGGTGRLAAAVTVLWVSTFLCIAGIVLPNRRSGCSLVESWHDPSRQA